MPGPQPEITLLTIGKIEERGSSDNIFEAQTGSALGHSILSNICSM
jgi:hypothetical protein